MNILFNFLEKFTTEEKWSNDANASIFILQHLNNKHPLPLLFNHNSFFQRCTQLTQSSSSYICSINFNYQSKILLQIIILLPQLNVLMLLKINWANYVRKITRLLVLIALHQLWVDDFRSFELDVCFLLGRLSWVNRRTRCLFGSQ